MINSAVLALSMMVSIEPLPFEQISNPIVLEHKCQNVSINEWQNIPKSNLSKAVSHIDEVCNASLDYIKPFLISKNIQFDDLALKARISLLNYQGFRSLNDNLRFTFGNKVYDESGKLLPQIGQYHYATKTIFLDNQVFYDSQSFNAQFARVLSHEIFHAVLKQNNLLEQLPNKESNEKFALEFEEYVETKRLAKLFQ